MEDEKIVALFWARKESALSALAEKYGEYCFCIANRILENRQDAEEAVNEAYWNAWNAMPPHRPEALAHFIAKLTRCAALKLWRKHHTEKRGGGAVTTALEELAECIPGHTQIEDALKEAELTKLLNTFLAALPPKQRQVFVLRYWHLFSIAQISAHMGYSESKTKSMLYHLRRKLLTQLKKDGVFLEL